MKTQATRTADLIAQQKRRQEVREFLIAIPCVVIFVGVILVAIAGLTNWGGV